MLRANDFIRSSSVISRMKPYGFGLLSLVAICNLSVACRTETKSAEPKKEEATAVKTQVEPAPQKEALPEVKARKPLNVLLLTIDSMRADMPWNGYDKEIAPRLSQLAKEGTVYSRAYSISSFTAKSVGALLSGKYPSSLYRNGWFFTGYPEDNLFFPEVLKQNGVSTMAGHAHGYFDRGKHLEQGFDRWEVVKGLNFDSNTDKNITSEKLTDLAIDYLKDEKLAKAPLFMWLHYMDPHDQYVKHEATPDFGKDNRGRYDSEIYHTDSHIGRLLDFAKTQSWWEDTVVIISADHGEAFGEHGMYKHAFELWDVLTHVPLVIWGPGIQAQRIDERRSHLDIAPTIVDLMTAGKVSESSFVGQSLWAELSGEKAAISHEPIALDLPEDHNNSPRKAVLNGDYKIIQFGRGQNFQLYNLSQDPGETVELSKKEPEKFEEMKTLFEKTWTEIPQLKPFGGMDLHDGGKATGPQNPAEEAQLKALAESKKK